MFDHVKFGVSDYAASKAFFLEALEPLGVAVVSEGPPTYGVELTQRLRLHCACTKPRRSRRIFTWRSRPRNDLPKQAQRRILQERGTQAQHAVSTHDPRAA